MNLLHTGDAASPVWCQSDGYRKRWPGWFQRKTSLTGDVHHVHDR